MKTTEFGAYSEDLCHSEKLWPFFPRLNESIAQRTPKARETYKHSTSAGLIGPLNQSVWWVMMTKLEVNTALYEQSQLAIPHQRGNYFTHLQSQNVFTRVQLQMSLIVFSTRILMGSKQEQQNWHHHCSVSQKTLSSFQTVFANCCSSSSKQSPKKIVSHHSLIFWENVLRFWFSYRNTPANPLKQIFDTEGGREMLWKPSPFVSLNR